MPAISPSDDIDPLRVLHERPDECANVTVTSPQKVFLAALAAGLVVGALFRPIAALIAVNAFFIAFYLLQFGYKVYLVWRSLGRPAAVEVSPGELRSIPDDHLPTYTILVPLFREAEVLDKLVGALGDLDYPASNLDIQLLVEEDDEATAEALRDIELPEQFRVVVVPESYPRTKPKACNYGLELADSELLVIYDAEDIPERDQLRKAVCAFRRLPEQVVCVQAKLNYFNPRQNLQTRWFTAEYSVWFDLFLPGLTSSMAPIPLGGTSNHFKLSVLQELAGWDPFNVTEDCDLGVRMHKHGYRTGMIESTTWEEANPSFFGWIRQRSRWVKGYIQTYLVHMRHPIELLKQLGGHDWFSFQMMVGGTVLCFLLNPVYWLLTGVWFWTHAEIISAMFPTAVYVPGVFCLLVGNIVFIYLNVAGCMARGYYDLVKYSVIVPVYWLMMSCAAYKAMGQLIITPHYWEKTQHGLSGGGGEPPEG